MTFELLRWEASFVMIHGNALGKRANHAPFLPIFRSTNTKARTRHSIDTRRLPTRVKSEYGVGGTVRRQLRVNIICIVLSIVENSIFTHLSSSTPFPSFCTVDK